VTPETEPAAAVNDQVSDSVTDLAPQRCGRRAFLLGAAALKPFIDYVEAGRGPADDRYPARYLLEQIGLRGGGDPAMLRRRGAPRLPACSCLRPIFCCSTSRRTTLTCPRSNGSKPNLRRARRCSSSSAMTGSSSRTCRGSAARAAVSRLHDPRRLDTAAIAGLNRGR
jgi:hypothetical protein